MSNKITIKRSAVPGKIPLPGDLEFGEFAINYADGNLFFKDSSNSVATLASTQFVSVTGNVTAAGNISGNYFIGNGAFLTGISGGGGNGTPLVATVNDFTGNGSTVAFTLSVTPSSENLTSVNIGGVSQLKTAYSITGNVITFSSAPAAGAAIEVTTLSGGGGGSSIENGTSNVAIPAANGNVTISVAGTDNVAVISASGVTVTGNISGSYILGNGSQLTGLPESYTNANVAAYLPTYTGNLVSLQGNVTTTANISASHVLGNGSGLSSLTGANVTGQVANALVSGTVYTAAQPNITSVGTLSSVSVLGNVAAGNIVSNAHVSAATLQTTGNAIIGGDLVVNGNTIQVNIDQLNVQDPIIGLGRGANNTPLTTNDGRDRGTEMWYYSGSEQAAFVGYQNSTGNIIAASNISVTNEIVTVNSYGNFVAGNVIGATVSATGNITGNYFVGNGALLTGLPESGLSWTTLANAAPSSPSPGDFWYDAYTGVKYQYINDGTSNIWVDQSFPTSFNTLAVVSNATIGGNLAVTGNITGNYFVGNGSQLTGLPAGYADSNVVTLLGSFGSNTISTTGNITSSNSIVTNAITVNSGNLTTAIVNGGSNGVGNIGSASGYFNTVFAKATSAQYADLAEIYSADQDYAPGTVLVFGGTHEVTVSNISHDIRAAGVVSTEPAHVMNSQAAGVAVALTGRVPCQVRGPVAKGEQLVNIEPGIAGAVNFDQYRPGCVIGKSLETIADSDVHTIEIAVGRY